MTEDAFERAGTYPRILGKIQDKAFTLEGCFQIRLNHKLFGGTAAETILVERIHRGVWYEPDEEACGDRIAVRLSHLVYWIMPPALEETRPKSVEEGKPVVELAGSKLPSIVVERPTGTMRIVQHLGVDGDQVALRSITQDVEPRFDSEGVQTWRELMRTVGELQDVVSLAMDRVACIEAVSLFHPDLIDDRREGHEYRLPIEMFAEWTDRTAWVEPKSLSPREVLFHHQVVGADGLARLLDTAAKYRAGLRMAIATRQGRMAYSSDRLLTCSKALESFDRKRLGPEPRNFKKRVSACVSLAGEPFARRSRMPGAGSRC